MSQEWDERWLILARVVATRSHCRSRQVGAVIVQNGKHISHGFNTSPIGSCIVRGECYEGLSECKDSELPSAAIHAEVTAIVQALKFHYELSGASIYSTVEPCLSCLKLIVASGIKKVYFEISLDKCDLVRDLFIEKNLISLQQITISTKMEGYASHLV